MNQRIIFFIFSNWSFFSFTSHHRERLTKALKFTQPEAQWFQIIETEECDENLILTCSTIAHNSNLEENVDFQQNSTGVLLALHEMQHQSLGHFPHLKLNFQKAVTEWYYHEKTVRILIPYSRVVIQKPL